MYQVSVAKQMFDKFIDASRLACLKLINDRFMCERKQVRFPRSKRKRIRRKWAKQAKNYRDVPLKTIYQLGDKLIGHPETLRRLSTEVDSESENDALFCKAVDAVLGTNAVVGNNATSWNTEGVTRESLLAAMKLAPKMPTPKIPDFFSSMFSYDYMPVCNPRISLNGNF